MLKYFSPLPLKINVDIAYFLVYWYITIYMNK